MPESSHWQPATALRTPAGQIPTLHRCGQPATTHRHTDFPKRAHNPTFLILPQTPESAIHLHCQIKRKNWPPGSGGKTPTEAPRGNIWTPDAARNYSGNNENGGRRKNSTRIILDMNKKDFTILLLPSVIFVMVAVLAFLSSHTIQKYNNSVNEGQNSRKFEAFVANVSNGKWQLTTDQWLNLEQLSQRVMTSDRKIINGAGEQYQSIIWLSLSGLFCQLSAIAFVARKMKKFKNGV